MGWRTYYDPYSLVPYMPKADGSDGFITYDDASSTFYCVPYTDWARGLGGTFIWSLDADYDGTTQDCLQRQRAPGALNGLERAACRGSEL